VNVNVNVMNDDDESANDDDESANDDDENANDDDENANDDDESANDDDESANDHDGYDESVSVVVDDQYEGSIDRLVMNYEVFVTNLHFRHEK
jgi:hypothetical protein